MCSFQGHFEHFAIPLFFYLYVARYYSNAQFVPFLITRCPSYQVKPGCTYVTDPSDPCCQIPSCLQIPTPVVTPTPGPGVNPTPGPNLTPSATPYPSPLPQGVTGSVIVKPPVPNLGNLFGTQSLEF